jgi:ATP-dependent RNA helicase DeaD
VLDEADEMLDLGFREDMEFILKTTPATRRTLLFSATLPRGIVALAKQYQQQAFRVDVAGDEGGHADIEYRAIRIAAADVEHGVVNVLRFFESPSAIVFCNTRNAVNHLQPALLERGFSVVALSGELTQNERTQALQALRDGRARVCVATDVAARGIDLPNLDLVVHSDLPNDSEVLQHRSGRTGRAGRKGVSVLLVPPARRRRAELLLDLAGIDAVWGLGPTAEEIRKLDQERMLGDAIFAEETTSDDLVLARALLAERSPEDIAAALARLYRARLPSPEDLLDPGQGKGQGSGRSRDDRHAGKDARNDGQTSRGDDREGRSGPKKKLRRDAMAEGSVWFRAAIGRKKNAEARWLLPMICRRGGVEKQDIGAIKRPDKEDNIRIEFLGDTPAERPHTTKSWDGPKHRPKDAGRDARREDRPRETAHKPHGKPYDASRPRFEHEPGAKRKKEHQARPDNDGRRHAAAAPAERGAFTTQRPAFKKKKKKQRG